MGGGISKSGNKEANQVAFEVRSKYDSGDDSRAISRDQIEGTFCSNVYSTKENSQE